MTDEKRPAEFVRTAHRIVVEPPESAEKYRLWQAEQMLQAAGFEPDEQGHWHPRGV